MAKVVELKIRTRYQRMHAAMLLAGTLKDHLDSRVANIAIEIETLLGAPGVTLNNVIDCFEPSSKRIILGMLTNAPTPEDAALTTLREARRRSQEAQQ